MSGTSLDGIDVAIVDVRGRGRFTLEAFETFAYPARVRAALLGVSNRACHTRDIARLNFELPRLYARAVRETCARHGMAVESLALVGCHGQTIYHEDGVCTLQIGDGNVLALELGVRVVSDFRPADMAVGGKGAPLAPYFDYLFFRHARRGRVLLNLGGIGNLTALPAGAGPEDVVAFDTGPGNMVMDQLTAIHTNGRQTFDRDGRIAARGHVDAAYLQRLLRHAYFTKRPPKTAGREDYGEAFVASLVATGLSMPDLIATAAAFTAATVADQIGRFVRPRMTLDELIVGGGGARNPVVMAHLAGLLPGVAVGTTSEHGVPADAKEAVIFAVLAYETARGRAGNLPAATGARRGVVLGKVSRGTC